MADKSPEERAKLVYQQVHAEAGAFRAKTKMERPAAQPPDWRG